MRRFLHIGLMLSLIALLPLSSCKKENGETPSQGVPTEYFISGKFQGNQVEATTKAPVNVSTTEGLTCLIALSNPQDYALIGIGSTSFYEASDILALKGKSLTYGMGRDQAMFVWFEGGAMFSSNWTVQDGNSNFKVTDVVEVGTNGTGQRTFALRGSFQCKVKDNVNAVNTTMLNGSFAILVEENNI